MLRCHCFRGRWCARCRHGHGREDFSWSPSGGAATRLVVYRGQNVSMLCDPAQSAPSLAPPLVSRTFTHRRRMPGETSAQACARHLKRELGITELNASEIEHVSTQLFVWDSRFALHSSLPCPRSIHKVLQRTDSKGTWHFGRFCARECNPAQLHSRCACS